MDWNDVAYFVALVEHETLTAAADALDVQHSTVSRRIMQLEESLGLRLFDRIGKRYLLTEDGERIYHHATLVQKDMKALQRLARERVEAVSEVVVTAPPTVMIYSLIPKLPEFYARHSHIRLILQGIPALVNLHERQADIALRSVKPQENDLTFRRLRHFYFAFYASKNYLNTHARHQWQFLTLSLNYAHTQWAANIIGDSPIIMTGNNFSFIKQGVLANLGIGFLPSDVAKGDDNLVQVAIHSDTPEMKHETLYMVMHEDVRRINSVRAVADFLVEVLGEE
ncbi:MAG: LysR family transcriptional regulator [Neisseria sp.]|uniref:LysR family transcriptional regulator n=1 Tax=Neisseria sp. TaxID=192066 RepID=UPI0026DBD441|nr:LysR family transcriptional regulator [Neisseria sp.]MDO4641254.1 LysR family transcriptional regulator [Neisseria sp.]